MSQNITAFSSDLIPLRAPQRWFKCVEYGPGLKIELPYGDEKAAITAGIAHLSEGHNGQVKIGYYGFRSRIIVYAAAELRALSVL